MARPTKEGVVIPINRSQLAHDRASEAGYDLVLLGQTSVGELEITASLQQTLNQEQVLGLHLTLPRIGKLTLGMAIEADGTARVASVARFRPDGTPAGAALPSEQALQTKLTALKVELQRERWKTASLEEQIAQLKARVQGIDAFKARLDAMEQEHHTQVRFLRKQAKQNQTNAEELSLAHAALVRERDQLKVQLDGAHHEIASLASDRTELEELVREESEGAAERERGLIVERNEALQERALLEERERTALAERDEAVAACAAWAERDHGLAAERDERERALIAQLEEAKATEGALAEERNQARSQLQEQESALAAEHDQTRAELHAKEAALAAALESARSSAGDATELRRELLEAQARIDTLLSEQAGTVSDAQLDEAQDKLAAALAKLTASEAENTKLQQKLAAETEAAEQARQRLAAETEAADQLRVENFDVKALADNAAAEGQRKGEELAALETKLAVLETELTTARSQLDELQQTTGKVRDEFSTQQVSLEDLAARLSNESDRASTFETSSQKLRAQVEQLTAERDARAKELQLEREQNQQRKARLEEEELRRDELIQDIAFIQSQVTDLSSSKGALLARLDGMAKRETKRADANSQMSSLLRDAEAVAADRATSLRKLQLRAEQMEARAAESHGTIQRLEQELEEGRTAIEQLKAVSSERDELKIQISFFQKQVGALQRQQEKRFGTPLPPGGGEVLVEPPRLQRTPAPPAIPAMSARELPRPATPRPIPVLTPQPVQATAPATPIEANEPTAPYAMPDPQLLASDEPTDPPSPSSSGASWLEEPTASHRLPTLPTPPRKRR